MPLDTPIGQFGPDFTRARGLTPEVETQIDDTPAQTEAGNAIRAALAEAVKVILANAPKRIFRRDEVEKLRKLGWSWRAIGKHLEVSASTLRAITHRGKY